MTAVTTFKQRHKHGLDPVRDSFLARYCPNPPLLRTAIDRLQLWDLREIAPDQALCSTDERAEACWLIISGCAEVRENDQHVVFRGPGHMVGEQAFLTTLLGKEFGRRSADIIARGPLKVVCFDASIQDAFRPEERAAWAMTLAAVVNEKLQEATRQRAELRSRITDRDALLSRFAEGDGLGVARKALDANSERVVNRELIVWFSDVANFSTWAADRNPDEVARVVRALTSCQIEVIRAAGGQIDKLMGDGVMALWFLGTEERRNRLPTAALESAVMAVKRVRHLFVSERLHHSLDIRIGLHNGKACFGDFGTRDRIAVTVLSKDVNLASRYEQAKDARLGPVRISPSMKELVEKSPAGAEWSYGDRLTVEVKHGLEIEIFCPTRRGV